MKKMIYLTGVLVLALLFSSQPAATVQAQGENELCGDTYTVQPRDYLVKIARECGVTYSALLNANPQIAYPNLIIPGQMLNIPDPDDSGGEVNIPVTGGSVYIVQPGDTLGTIAARFQVTAAELIDANPGFSDTQNPRAGQQIRLPEGAARIPTASVTPATAGANSLVTIAATGFRADSEVVIGFGRTGSQRLTEVGRGTTNSNGAIYRTLRLPEWADEAGQYLFVVQRADDPNIRSATNPLLLTIQTGSGNGSGIPVTGPSAIIVQPGETLSEIAFRYNTTIEELLDLNPTIEDPRVIYRGQRIVLPEGVRPVNPWVGVNDRRVVPGQQLRVRAINFPANAIVDVNLSPVGEERQAILDARTDEHGELLVTITVPENAVDGETWWAVVTTTERPDGTRATSRPFVIDGN